MYEKPTANIIFNGERRECFSLDSGARQICLLLPLVFNITLKDLARAIRQEKEMQGIYTGKKKKEKYLFVDDVVLYVENPKKSIKNQLLLRIEFSRGAGYELNIQKMVFL